MQEVWRMNGYWKRQSYSREGGWRKKGCVCDRTGREGDTINDIIHRVWLHTVGIECYCTRW